MKRIGIYCLIAQRSEIQVFRGLTPSGSSRGSFLPFQLLQGPTLIGVLSSLRFALHGSLLLAWVSSLIRMPAIGLRATPLQHNLILTSYFAKTLFLQAGHIAGSRCRGILEGCHPGTDRRTARKPGGQSLVTLLEAAALVCPSDRALHSQTWP